MVTRAALILAGGKARRFQSENGGWEDKALATFGGKSLLVHGVENVQGVVDEVWVSVDDEKRGAHYIDILKQHGFRNVRVVVDEQSDVSGPTLAITSGLRRIEADFCLTVPCDMPFLAPKVADYLFKQAKDFDVITPMWPNGRLETLLTVLKRGNGLEVADTLCRLKRPRSDDIQRGAAKVLLALTVGEIKKFDPELKSFININSKEDLEKPRSRPTHGPITQSLILGAGNLGVSDLQRLRDGAKMAKENRFSEAAKIFGASADSFGGQKSFFWAAVSRENQGEALLNLSKQQVEAEKAVEVDFAGKEAFVAAADDYRLEAEVYEQKLCRLLAERAFFDKAWVESWAMGKHSHVRRYPSKVA